MNFCFLVRAVTDCIQLLLQTQYEEYNIKNACYAELYLSYCSPTCGTSWVPVTSFSLYLIEKHPLSSWEVSIYMDTYTQVSNIELLVYRIQCLSKGKFGSDKKPLAYLSESNNSPWNINMPAQLSFCTLTVVFLTHMVGFWEKQFVSSSQCSKASSTCEHFSS